jgi:hypothetical protein
MGGICQVYPLNFYWREREKFDNIEGLLDQAIGSLVLIFNFFFSSQDDPKKVHDHKLRHALQQNLWIFQQGKDQRNLQTPKELMKVKDRLDAAKYVVFIVLTCFGHKYAHYQEYN